MGLRCGIVGLPNVGKSTLFNCLTNAKAQAANFPFCTIEPNIGMINIPDNRLIKLAELVKPEKVTPTTFEILDIAGLVKGASKGEGLGNQFLANIRETDAIIHILRCFDDPNVIHVDGSVNPVRDKNIVDMELQLKDLDTVQNRISKIEKQAIAGGDKSAKRILDVLKIVENSLIKGESLRTLKLDHENKALIYDLHLLTLKPILYVCNVDADSAVNGNHYVDEVKSCIANEESELLIIAAGIEAEIAEFDTFEERMMFLKDIGLDESGLNKLIKSAYKLLGLRTFFTAGPKEARAWTITKGTKAPEAAGTIHSDFEKGFIRAEVIKYNDYIAYGSEASCKEAGKMYTEGKDYVVLDGDVIYFRFNV